MAVLYYFPGATEKSRETVEKAGLGDFVREGENGPEFADVMQGGPDGGRGLVAAWRGLDPESGPRAISAVASGVRWQQARPDPARGLQAGRYWLGIESDRPTSPMSLQRRQRFPGSPVRLKDGQEWIVPIAEQLPHRHGLDEAGRYQRSIEGDYRWFWDESCKYAETIFGELDGVDWFRARGQSKKAEVSVRLADAWGFCAGVLALNYRINAELLDRLDLLDDAALVRIILAALDLPEIGRVREKKKKDYRLAIPVS